MEFIKLKDLVGKSMTVQTVDVPQYQMWSEGDRRMITSPTYQDGFRKVYPVTTEQGLVNLGSGQLGSLLEATVYQGKADLIGKKFNVKSNGKSGMDIRYYFNLAGSQGGGAPMQVVAPQSDASSQNPAEASTEASPF